MTKRSNLMDAIRSAAQAGAIRSSLGRWFISNHAEFAETLEKFRPRWEVLVEKFAEEKVIQVSPDFWAEDPETRKVARRRVVDAARKIWLRVDAQVKAKQALGSSGATAPLSRPPAPAPLDHGLETENEPEFTTLRGRKI